MAIKKITTLVATAIIIFSFSGCAEVQNSLQPLIQTCCVDKAPKQIEKKIFIGKYSLSNNQNKEGTFGNRKLYLSDKLEPITFQESFDFIVRNELLRRLSKVSKNVILVDEKPKDLANNDIYIEGNVNNLWIEQQYVNYNTDTFDFTNLYKLNLESILNNQEIKDTFDSKLKLKSQPTNITRNTSGVIMAVLFNLHAFNEAVRGDIAKLINHELYINNKKIANIDYSQFLESGVGRFTTDYSVAIKADIYGKNPQIINDSNQGNVNKFQILDMPYTYISPNLNTSSGYTYAGSSTFEFYKSKEQLAKLEEEFVIAKNEYNKCLNGRANILENKKCDEPTQKNIGNSKYYDIFRQYTTTSGILQYMINEHIDNIIEKIEKL